MQNTNDYINSENTTRILKLHEQWAKDNGYRPQAPSAKPQALKDLIKRILNHDPRVSNKESRIKAPSFKRHGSWNKFQGPLIMGPDQDKSILWMGLMEGNLMW